MKSSVLGRALPLLLAVCLLLWPLGGAVEWAPGLAGDLNRDQKIDAADALAILQHCVELVTLSAEQQNFSDLNGDGAVNASDALLILQHSVDLIDRFPVELQADGGRL